MNKIQEIYINLDDSGKLTNHEHICVYGGLVFLSKSEKDKFITQYRSIIESIKCNYCDALICNKKCPEIKNININKIDKRRIMNYIKKYYTIALIIENDKVYEHIKSNKSSRGRFIDYGVRRLIKKIIKELILAKKINPNKHIRLIINMDEQATKSNGYYNLKDGLYEELKYGIINYDYENRITPIIYGNLEIKLTYQKSNRSYVVQAADLLAGTIRREALNNNEIKNIDFQIILPEKKKVTK